MTVPCKADRVNLRWPRARSARVCLGLLSVGLLGCSGKAEAVTCAGVVEVELLGSTRDGTQRVELCVDDLCWRGDPVVAWGKGETLASAGAEPVEARPRFVRFAIGQSRPTRITSKVIDGDAAAVGSRPLGDGTSGKSGCYRPAYQLDLRIGTLEVI